MKLYLAKPGAPFPKPPTPEQTRRKLESLAHEDEEKRLRREREARAEYERRFAAGQKG